MKEEGAFLIGGALLDTAGQMIGSMMLLQFDDPTGVDQWMAKEPYLAGNVWQTVEIKPFRIAEV